MEDETLFPVYLSFRTFLGVIDNLRENGLPSQVDKSIFASRSGSDQSQIMSALRFLGLIDEDHKTQQDLERLVGSKANSQEEKQVFSEILKKRYAKIFDQINPANTTINQVQRIFSDYGCKGTTIGRAVRFFIRSLEYCEMEVSTRLTARARRGTQWGTRSRFRASAVPAKKNGQVRAKKTLSTEDDNIDQGIEKKVSLQNGAGVLSLFGRFNTFELSEDERKLVFNIVDLMQAFEKKTEST